MIKMNAKKCDVCGKFFLPNHYIDGRKTYTKMYVRAIDKDGLPRSDDGYDLCEDCSISLYEWLKSQGADNAETC